MRIIAITGTGNTGKSSLIQNIADELNDSSAWPAVLPTSGVPKSPHGLFGNIKDRAGKNHKLIAVWENGDNGNEIAAGFAYLNDVLSFIKPYGLNVDCFIIASRTRDSAPELITDTAKARGDELMWYYKSYLAGDTVNSSHLDAMNKAEVEMVREIIFF